MTPPMNDGESELSWPGAPRLLTDWEIRAACLRHRLVTVGDSVVEEELERRVRHCSYELTVSERAMVLVADHDRTIHQSLPSDDGSLWIPPGSTVRVFSREVLNLDPFIFAQCIGLGQLFSAGVVVGSTYVDPGTRGAIYLALNNSGDRALRVACGDPLARAFFTVLGSPVERPHPGTGSRRKIHYWLGDVSSSKTSALRESIERDLATSVGHMVDAKIGEFAPAPAVELPRSAELQLVASATAGVVAMLVSWLLVSAGAYGLGQLGFGWPVWIMPIIVACWTGSAVANWAWQHVSGTKPPAWSERLQRVFVAVMLALVVGGLAVTILSEYL